MLFYDANDRLTGGAESYDDNGNTIASAGFSVTYDFENRLVRREDPTVANDDVIVVYNGDGQRVEKRVQTGPTTFLTTRYLVDDLNPTGFEQVILETVVGQTAARQYVYGLDLISQRRQTGSSTFVVSYYGYDGHGSVRQLTDSAGAVTDTYTYDAFGNLIAQTFTAAAPTPNHYLYAGEQFDSDLNLYYNRARYLDVRSGRFWSMDPFEGDSQSPASLHRYLYAHNDPVNFADPSGLAEFTVLGVTFNLTIQAVLRSVSIGTTQGVILGGIAGGIDAALGDEDVVEGIRQGAIAGLLLGPFARIRVGLALLGLFGIVVGTQAAADSFENGHLAQGAFRTGLTVLGAIGAVRAIGSLLRGRGITVRAPQDVAREANYPNPRPAKSSSPIGSNPAQAEALARAVRIARFLGAEDIRINQEQVNAFGVRVGRNRPDLQLTFRIFGRRIRLYMEFDPPNGTRGPGHRDRILANDPDGIVILRSI